MSNKRGFKSLVIELSRKPGETDAELYRRCVIELSSGKYDLSDDVKYPWRDTLPEGLTIVKENRE